MLRTCCSACRSPRSKRVARSFPGPRRMGRGSSLQALLHFPSWGRVMLENVQQSLVTCFWQFKHALLYSWNATGASSDVCFSSKQAEAMTLKDMQILVGTVSSHRKRACDCSVHLHQTFRTLSSGHGQPSPCQYGPPEPISPF